MHLSQLTVRNFRQFGEGHDELQISFLPGVTALVGRNDSGKSAVIDAVRYVLLTRDQEYIRVQPEDFHIDNAGKQATEIYIVCKLAGLTDAEKGAFTEYLSYEGDDVVLYVTWTARKLSEAPGTRRWIDLSVRSGIDGAGPPFDTPVRELFSAAYLRSLRDAEREMSPGRGSRLSQIFSNVPEISEGEKFNAASIPEDAAAVGKLGLVGLSDYMRYNVKHHAGVRSAQDSINKQYLTSLSLRGDDLQGNIDVSGEARRARDSGRFWSVLSLVWSMQQPGTLWAATASVQIICCSWRASFCCLAKNPMGFRCFWLRNRKLTFIRSANSL